ncbi:hypothetical protein [Thalassospira sp. MCCC 1A01428]|uniref:hypothetical protein n=1 Tax=Thalassospira sp. MCCC 1A01428 TaxID=1470575 RepID=UPI000A1FC5D5|nr:hypothetical protein [Thalassospira sp. MCCC 1A01428]OSQ45540.1 hypothetical protein THS27_04195 [Thalassospira sp. MCCC 1A01428]
MSFVLRENHTFKRKIEVKVPTDTGFKAESFTATFAAIDSDEAKELYEAEDTNKDRVLLDRVFIGCDGIKDEDGNDETDTASLREMLSKIPYVALPLITAFWNGLSGQKTKN